MNFSERESRNLSPIEIGFGYEFEGSRGEGRFIIVDVERGKTCAACGVKSINGKEALGIAGTTDRENIEVITGRWNLGRVLNALMNQFGDTQPQGRIYELVRKNSHQKPRMFSM